MEMVCANGRVSQEVCLPLRKSAELWMRPNAARVDRKCVLRRELCRDELVLDGRHVDGTACGCDGGARRRGEGCSDVLSVGLSHWELSAG